MNVWFIVAVIAIAVMAVFAAAMAAASSGSSVSVWDLVLSALLIGLSATAAMIAIYDLVHKVFS